MLSIEEKLRQTGLSGNEAKVYLELIRGGSINGSSLAKKTGLDRSITYQVLNNLVGKGFVNYIIKEHKKYFSATDPSNLLHPIKEQEDIVTSLISDLKEIKKSKEIQPSVEVYEGKSGLKILFEEILASNELCFFGATGKSYDFLQWGMERIEKEFVKKKIRGRGIASKKMIGLRWNKLKNINLRYIEGGNSENTSFGVMGQEKVGIICLEQEKPLIIMIKNKFIARTLKNYFEFMWKAAKS